MSVEVAVAVASHRRPLRLRWLLNALEDQTLSRERFEVVVAHDADDARTAEVLATHPLAQAGIARAVAFAGRRLPGPARNAAWRASVAPLVAFTDDDCRPCPQWLDALVARAREDPGAVVQGATRPDMAERGLLLAAPHALSQDVEPPTIWGQTCNIAYPRAVLERLGGFEESARLAGGEDCDLLQRALAAGAAHVAVPGAVAEHAVHPVGLAGRLRTLGRWQHLAFVARRHPGLRASFTARVFWKPSHPLVLLALAGLARGQSRSALALLSAPWVARRLPRYGRSARGLLRAGAELPGLALVDLAEIAVLAYGSLRYGTVLL